jgi:DNA polymerase V
MTNPYNEQSRYFNMKTVRLPFSTNDTSELIAYARRGFDEIYKEGYLYKKAGVIFRDLSSDSLTQTDLFAQDRKEHAKEVMEAFDKINKKYGRDSIRYAVTGSTSSPKWKTGDAFVCLFGNIRCVCDRKSTQEG